MINSFGVGIFSSRSRTVPSYAHRFSKNESELPKGTTYKMMDATTTTNFDEVVVNMPILSAEICICSPCSVNKRTPALVHPKIRIFYFSYKSTI